MVNSAENSIVFGKEKKDGLFLYRTVIKKEPPQLHEESRKPITTYYSKPKRETQKLPCRRIEDIPFKVVSHKKNKSEKLKQTVVYKSQNDIIQNIEERILQNKKTQTEPALNRFAFIRLFPDTGKQKEAEHSLSERYQMLVFPYTNNKREIYPLFEKSFPSNTCYHRSD